MAINQILEVENQKSEVKSTGGNMAKTKMQGENSACMTLFECGILIK